MGFASLGESENEQCGGPRCESQWWGRIRLETGSGCSGSESCRRGGASRTGADAADLVLGLGLEYSMLVTAFLNWTMIVCPPTSGALLFCVVTAFPFLPRMRRKPTCLPKVSRPICLHLSHSSSIPILSSNSDHTIKVVRVLIDAPVVGADVVMVATVVVAVGVPPGFWCNFCNSLGHHAPMCPQCSAPPFAAYHAFPLGAVNDLTWYFDIGATHHMTNHGAAFHDPAPYNDLAYGLSPCDPTRPPTVPGSLSTRHLDPHMAPASSSLGLPITFVAIQPSDSASELQLVSISSAAALQPTTPQALPLSMHPMNIRLCTGHSKPKDFIDGNVRCLHPHALTTSVSDLVEPTCFT
ncbi:GDSL esterase/lipase 5-like [Pyrus ussuriensis x Pyrus communis]|uniref:GDSL esterase/lipase 5-like n=1 Tax=Pyrus ussuriensis x Pyrus communis TaxID=2448454 RepID=A0A5N5GBH5_9ROSA|nr:GDSL esterase/lipase 5-like [Pyrus ussuriensis x Pyrus communis]